MKKEVEKYIQVYLRQFSHLGPEVAEFIQPYLSIRQIPKGEYYLSSGEIQHDMGFVYEGLCRRFFINDKGNEITTGFIQENEYVTDYPAFIRQQPSKYHIQCLEPSIVVNLPYEVIQESYRKFRQSEMQGRLIAEKVLTILSDRVESFLFLTAEERYLNFLANHEDLMNRVSLTHLASFLGIERQSLSRIRKRIASK
ncbi:Crp/Fnr family transcriptional regulator [Echinicola vietnamensis]|uniref:cAMP-binding protein n=1 Tax=Echinicola vietnamensis (strain DSM 17526 / LMG 23754 / KMM 6221) TaxID=926556 RepID=L0FZJ8_ECHVK|nr:Crp/Fnr family transcriptional regulator [Echinicola vietnamensis]AGA79359.1 cAMP-binding protein [Echinicola vietnamensis DSM 17526]